MNKIDYLDAMKFNGTGSIGDIFTEWGRIAMTNEMQADMEISAVELKATTVRIPVDLMSAFDATLNHFGLSRQDAFAHMVYQFIADSIAGYCFGYAGNSEGNDAGRLDIAIEQFDAVIASFPKEQQAHIRSIAADALNMKLGGEYV